MGKLIYSAIASADGYTEDAAGKFDWAAPDDEVHRFINDLERRRWQAGAPPTASAWIWNYWTRSGSQEVPSTSGTAPSQRDHHP